MAAGGRTVERGRIEVAFVITESAKSSRLLRSVRLVRCGPILITVFVEAILLEKRSDFVIISSVERCRKLSYSVVLSKAISSSVF